MALTASVVIGLGADRRSPAGSAGASAGPGRSRSSLFAAAAIVHLLQGPDPLAALLSVGMLLALIWFRDDFRAQSDRGSLPQALAFVPVYLVGVFLFTWITLCAERNHIDPDLTFWGVFKTAYGGMIGLGTVPYIYHHEVFRDFFQRVADRARDRRR